MDEEKSAAPGSGHINHYFGTAESLGMDGIDVQLRDFDEQQPAEEVIEVDKRQGVQWERQTSGNPFKETLTLNKYLPACMNLNQLKPFFDVSSRMIGKRLLFSMIPFNKRFFNDFNEKPDLYGPFWVLTSLIATLFISSNLARYINWPEDSDDKFFYSFTILPVAAGLLYGLGFGLPVLIKVLLNLYGHGDKTSDAKSLLSAVGIYGYSFTSMILTAFLCGCLKWEWVQWLLIAYSGITSIGFLWTTYWEDFKENLETKLRWIAVGMICAVQLTLLLVFKFYFFSQKEFGNSTAKTEDTVDPIPIPAATP